MLSLLDIRAEIVASTGGESLQRLGRIDEDTLVIALSAGRAHPLLLRAMKLALHRGARTLAISDATISEVGEHAELTLYFSSNSPVLHRVRHGADGAGPGARPRRLRARRSRAQRPHPRLQTEVTGASAGEPGPRHQRPTYISSPDDRARDFPRQDRPRRDAQGRGDHGRGHARAGEDRRGGRRLRGDGAGAGSRRHPPRRRRRPDVATRR